MVPHPLVENAVDVRLFIEHVLVAAAVNLMRPAPGGTELLQCRPYDLVLAMESSRTASEWTCCTGPLSGPVMSDQGRAQHDGLADPPAIARSQRRCFWHECWSHSPPNRCSREHLPQQRSSFFPSMRTPVCLKRYCPRFLFDGARN
jgi:hypothetical protein